MNAGWGELFSLLAAATWAVGVILYRQLGLRLPPLSLNFLKNLLVFGALLPLALILDAHAWPALSGTDIALALVSGLIGIAVADTLYFKALNALGAARMGIIGNSYSPLVVVLSLFYLGERLDAQQWLGFALVSGGVLLVVWPPRMRMRPDVRHAPDALPEALSGAAEASLTPPLHLKGALTGLLSILLMAISIVMIKPTLEAHPLLPITLVRMVGALAGMLAISALRGGWRRLWPESGRIDWLRLGAAALFGQALSMLFWLAGYKLTDASVAAILNETASVFILLLAWVWLRERPGRRGLFGVALTLAGVLCMLAVQPAQ